MMMLGAIILTMVYGWFVLCPALRCFWFDAGLLKGGSSATGYREYS